ncbi:MAG: hypothetical protein Q9208_001174 [Pyrenodesmia sp. 3 TL-2023]
MPYFIDHARSDRPGPPSPNEIEQSRLFESERRLRELVAELWLRGPPPRKRTSPATAPSQSPLPPTSLPTKQASPAPPDSTTATGRAKFETSYSTADNAFDDDFELVSKNDALRK